MPLTLYYSANLPFGAHVPALNDFVEGVRILLASGNRKKAAEMGDAFRACG